MTTNLNNKRPAEQADDCKRRKLPEEDDDDDDDCIMFSAARPVHCVVFDLEPNILFIPNRLEYTEEQAEDIWYSRMEKHAMIQGAMKSACDMHPEEEGARGLEPFTWIGATSRRDHRQRTVGAVLREQARQKQYNKECDDELLYRASTNTSQRCQELANARGYMDQVAVFPLQLQQLPSSHDDNDNDNDDDNKANHNAGGGTVLKGFKQTLRGLSFGWLGTTADPQ
ncbi:expressed unknown protein [Seminavis robusta]|uniref:Uncharacterized protein n=1 Tax=Seminavis robusta TaxID=568900 RepID=A0A9N8H4R1_9STRA|nr:expressed unknown protein [Seminavis robusta]|eukprot:Sro12_g009080.1 n/a (226) ;mRNA; f:14210-14887